MKILEQLTTFAFLLVTFEVAPVQVSQHLQSLLAQLGTQEYHPAPPPSGSSTISSSNIKKLHNELKYLKEKIIIVQGLFIVFDCQYTNQSRSGY